MRARPSSSPVAALAVTTCLLASVVPAADARSLGSNSIGGGGIFPPRRTAEPISSRPRPRSNACVVKANGGCAGGSAAASRAAGRIPIPSEQNLQTSGSSLSENSLEEALSVRGGGLFGGRRKEEGAESADANADNIEDEDDEEDGLYPLTDDTMSAAAGAAEDVLADDNDDGASAPDADPSDDIEIDMSSATTSADSGPSRTVEVQATSRHLFSRDPNSGGPRSSLLSRIFPSSPILPAERSSFLALSTMMFLFIYVFTTVRDTKDALVVSHCGAESIPYLKLYGVLPCAMMFIVGYSKASNLLGKEALFYVTLVPFFVFYSLFAFVLYPNRDSIHFPKLGGVQTVADAAPGPLSLIRYWSFSLYFIVSELWASAGVPLLFWQVSLVPVNYMILYFTSQHILTLFQRHPTFSKPLTVRQRCHLAASGEAFLSSICCIWKLCPHRVGQGHVAPGIAAKDQRRRWIPIDSAGAGLDQERYMRGHHCAVPSRL